MFVGLIVMLIEPWIKKAYGCLLWTLITMNILKPYSSSFFFFFKKKKTFKIDSLPIYR
jgi:hypothetical protein